MPKVSRVNKIRTKPGEAPPERDKLDKYICTRCGKIYTRQKQNFPASQSPLYRGGGGYLPVCNHCVDNLFDHYKEALGSSEAAMERICMKFDIYWQPEIYKMINKINSSASRVRQYISKTFLIKYIGRSYDDTLDENAAASAPVEFRDIAAAENADEMSERKTSISHDTLLFWGPGFDEDAYRELELRFERWTKDLPKPLSIVEEALYKQICIQELSINRNIAAGKDIERGQSTLNSLLSSLNIKPNQNKDDADADLDSTPLGVWAQRWEERRPIPEYKDEIPEPKIIKYITTWFYGHIAKALGLNNMYSQVYEDEIARYRVTKPEYEDESDDHIIADITGGDDT